MSKLQDADFKTLAQLTALGGDQTDLLNTTKLYTPKSADQLEDVLRKHNFAATTAPANSNDNTEGYEVGSFWHDTTNDVSYVALDVSTAAAVWKNITASGGGAIGTWQSAGALTIGGANTNPTKGTTAVDGMWYQEIDNTLFCRLEYEQTTSGSGGSGDYFIDLPSGYTIDTSVLGRTTFANNDTRTPVFGSCKIANTSAESTTGGLGVVGMWSTTQIRLIIHEGNAQRYWASDKLGLGASVIHAYAWFSVPIV